MSFDEITDATMTEPVYGSVVCSRCGGTFPNVVRSDDERSDSLLCEPCRGALFSAHHDI